MFASSVVSSLSLGRDGILNIPSSVQLVWVHESLQLGAGGGVGGSTEGGSLKIEELSRSSSL